ncbi:thioredoxin domain-containing protein 16 [Aplochiton taeniatus]
MAFLCFVTCLLYTVGRCIAVANSSSKHTAASFNEKIQSGNTLFVYFGQQINPTIQLFLDQLEKSAEALQDYGISVATVNCSKEMVTKFCKGDKLMTKAYLFRGGEVLKSFDLDTVFDVNAIVSHSLFTVLYEEVRFVQTAFELQALENAAKGEKDIVLGHVPVFGLADHRALMETAFVYGAKYQFVLTNGEPVLEHLRGASGSSVAPGLWFLHCGSASQPGARCPVTALTKAPSTLTIYCFLQLMEAPLLTEVLEDPSSVELFPSHLQAPLLFLYSQPHTEASDRGTAQTVAWRLRGRTRVLLVHRESPAVKTPQDYNAAYRLPGEEIKYLTLNNLEEVVDLFNGEINEVEMATVDCGEWTDVCAAQPITWFPTVLVLRPHEPAQLYRGMLGAASLLRFILLSAMEYPAWLADDAEVSSFLHGTAELSVENLPSYLGRAKPLLLLFVGREDGGKQRVLEEMRGLVRRGHLQRYLACWVHLGRTPAGVSVLEAYLGYLPPIPALVLSHVHGSGEVFHYPPQSLIVGQSVLQWIQSVEEGVEPPAGSMGDRRWAPAVPFYDFLAAMDQDVDGYAAQTHPKTKPRGIPNGVLGFLEWLAGLLSDCCTVGRMRNALGRDQAGKRSSRSSYQPCLRFVTVTSEQRRRGKALLGQTVVWGRTYEHVWA